MSKLIDLKKDSRRLHYSFASAYNLMACGEDKSLRARQKLERDILVQNAKANALIKKGVILQRLKMLKGK